MDQLRLDDLARLAAGLLSRRSIMKTLGGVVAAGTGGALVWFVRDGSSNGGGESTGGAKASAMSPATPVAIETVAPPAIALSIESGSPGQTGNANVTGFHPGETVELRVASKAGSAAVVEGTTTVSADGGATLAFTIPAKAPPGQSLIQVTGQSSGALASTFFDVGCAAGLNDCTDICVDLQTDAHHCGGCGVVCKEGDICQDGACVGHQIPAIDAFFAKYDGVCVDFDGAYGDQCMDLAEFYNRDVVGAPQIGGDAVDAWIYYPDAYYVQIPNAAKNVPQKGDVIVWDSDLGDGSGHIAVCVEANENGFTSFDQNWPLDSCCHYQYHDSYDGVLGWLRPKW